MAIKLRILVLVGVFLVLVGQRQAMVGAQELVCPPGTQSNGRCENGVINPPCCEACPAAQSCPKIVCGIPGGTVPDGNCGRIQCPDAPACPSSSPAPRPSNSPAPRPSSSPIIMPSASPAPVVKLGDANKDNVVNEADFAVWLLYYNQTIVGGPAVGDFDANGKVDGVDYVIWLIHYGE